VVPGAKRVGVIAINRDHKAMVRFSTAEDTEFRKIWGTIFIMVKTCAGKIKENWDSSDIVKMVGAFLATFLRIVANSSSTPSLISYGYISPSQRIDFL
jgi:hypothetical protein